MKVDANLANLANPGRDLISSCRVGMRSNVMYDALSTAVSLAVSQSVMMTILIFLSTAQRADNDPPGGVPSYSHTDSPHMTNKLSAAACALG